MKIIDHFYDYETGESGVREIEIPDADFHENARIAEESATRQIDQTRLARLRADLLDRILSGEPLTDAERAEFRRLRDKQK